MPLLSHNLFMPLLSKGESLNTYLLINDLIVQQNQPVACLA